jgi:predicted nucleic-acid-binding protein
VIGLDTNVLVRYFAQDDRVQSRASARFIEGTLSTEAPGHVSLVALAELVWVLRASFAAQRAEVVSVVTQLLAGPQFVIQEPEAVWIAVDAFEQDNVDFADALIAALDRRRGCSHTVTFDRAATRMPGVVMLT